MEAKEKSVNAITVNRKGEGMIWIRIAIVCFACILYKLLRNYQSYYTLKKFDEKFKNSLSKNQPEATIKLSEYSVIVQKLLFRAGVALKTVPVELGGGYVNANANPFDYLDSGSNIVNGRVSTAVSQGIGVYKQRIFEAINPLFWINSLLFLPQNIIIYCGGNPVSAISKALNIAWWTIGALISIFSSDIREFIKAFLSAQ